MLLMLLYFDIFQWNGDDANIELDDAGTRMGCYPTLVLERDSYTTMECWNGTVIQVMVDERHYGLSWVSGVDNKIGTV